MTPRRVFARALGASLAAALVPSIASAQYLDPGAGSIIVQAVIAGVVAVAAGLRLYWGRISAAFSRKPKDGAGN